MLKFLICAFILNFNICLAGLENENKSKAEIQAELDIALERIRQLEEEIANLKNERIQIVDGLGRIQIRARDIINRHREYQKLLEDELNSSRD